MVVFLRALRFPYSYLELFGTGCFLFLLQGRTGPRVYSFIMHLSNKIPKLRRFPLRSVSHPLSLSLRRLFYTSYSLRYALYAWRSVYKAHLHIEVNFTHVKIGGNVSDNLSGDTSDLRKTVWVHTFVRVKLEWNEWV